MGSRLGLIAGNGTFPLLVLDAARAKGHEVVVAAIREEADASIEKHGALVVHWLSLGELGKLIDTFKDEGVSEAIMVNATASAVATAMPLKKLTPSAIRPRMAIHTIVPANSTARPDVLIAFTIDSETGMPRRRFRRCRVTMNSA